MMIAIYGRSFEDSFIPHVQQLFDSLHEHNQKITVYESFYPYLKTRIDIKSECQTFKNHGDVAGGLRALLSIGGDGTLLETIHIVRDSQVPVLGINTGRLGFLSSIGKDEIKEAIDAVLADNYQIDSRALIELEVSDPNLFPDFRYALNELTVHKKDSSSMVTIHTYINDSYLNSYWADGLIIATPTGSTAYSLSTGGPILLPGSKNFIITPIAAHNLNVRPVVVPDDSVLKLTVEGRSNQFLASLDSRSEPIDASTELIIKRAPFDINLIRLEHQNFLNTMRNKLMWGLDRRN